MAKEKEKKPEQAEQKQQPPKEAAPAEEGAKETSADSKKTKSKGGSLLVWIIMLVVVLAGVAGGFGLAVTLAKPAQPEAEETEQENKNPKIEDMINENAKDAKTWSYELPPIVACLDEPSLTRYVRAAITLEMSPELDPVKGQQFLAEQEPILRDWLTTYFFGKTLLQVQGSKNIERIKVELFNSFNEILFPDSKALIKRILFKEFVIQ
jgi:flagellar basal body-associated protein FliL